MLQQAPGLYFADSGIHRLGVFCAHDLHTGDVIEICPVIILNSGTVIEEGDTLYQYYFVWGQDHLAIALGYGSLYNHSATPNADFTPDLNDDTLIITALQDIPTGTEITIDYHAGDKTRALWF